MRPAGGLVGAVALIVIAGLFAAGCSGGGNAAAKGSSASTSSVAGSSVAATGSGSAHSTNSKTTAKRTAGHTTAKAGSSASSTSGPSATGPTSAGGSATTGGKKIAARRTPFTKAVTYPDGIALKILKVTQHKITAIGPGAMTGKPQTTFTIIFTNNSHRVVSLNQVIVSVVYGPAHTSAPPVYGSGVADFSGSVKPGKSTQTEYSFSVPTPDLGQVTMSVVFDGLHAAASFSGRVSIK